MSPLKATVHRGRLILDAPTDLPDGTEVELIPADGWDDLDAEERARLHGALEASEDDVDAGRVLTVDELLTRLDRPRQ